MTYKKCPKPSCDGELINMDVLGYTVEENNIYRCNKCRYTLTLEAYKLIPDEKDEEDKEIEDIIQKIEKIIDEENNK